ncbi:MAG: type IV secretory system conjugative DNA transfer family protein [Parvibaculum sp.]|uniref:type IV secretory system conjugative DNA transfer family protein n=1 Tax=Parvibaculum sp. TaxID=2024848 RepID=UPI002ABB1AA6|nr:type IV secretory system conjugative DNA transfer family protein [Parvibaculum sp.]MDZ4380782.1 type IV secretory system conjugative DNA transfer family protein [Parvibaculum sp.]
MVFGLFGKKKAKPRDDEHWRDRIDPAHKEALEILEASGEVGPPWVPSYRAALRFGKMDEANDTLRGHIVPKLSKETYERLLAAGGSNCWAGFNDLAQSGYFQKQSEKSIDRVKLGYWSDREDQPVKPEILFSGDGHLLTVAPTGAGKSQRYILPTALTYNGPILILDPKGEVYKETAWRRSWHGPVFKFAPFDENSDHFNPLEFVTDWDDARVLADLLITVSGKGDPFWDSSARDLVRGLIMYVVKVRPGGVANIREILRLLSPSDEEFEDMLDALRAANDEGLLELANSLEKMSEKMRASIQQVARAQLDVWRSEAVERVTSDTTEEWAPEAISTDAYFNEEMANHGIPLGGKSVEGTVVQGVTPSIYLIVPPDKIGSYRSVLRVMLGMHLNGAIKANQGERDPKPLRPYLFIFDELPQLGYMELIENAVAVARSANIRLWLFVQDLAQLRETFPKWESILANCKAQIFFKPGDLGTAEYLSRLLGRRQDVLGADRELATPQELMGPNFDGKVVLRLAGQKPVKAVLPEAFYEDEQLQEYIATHKHRKP